MTDPTPRKQRIIQAGPVALALLGKEPLLRKAIKVDAHTNVSEDLRKSLKVSEVSVEILNGVPALKVVVDDPSLPPDANPFYFVNPPVIHNDKEDIEGAFEAIVTDAIAHARAHGSR